METLLEDYVSLPSAHVPQHTPLNKFHIFKVNGVKTLNYEAPLRMIRDNPVPESQVSAWAQTFSSTFLLDYMGGKLMQFTVKSLNTERMWPTQWPSLCWGKDGATTARLPGCHHSQLTPRTSSMRLSVSTKTSHSWALPTQGVVALWERTKSCPNLCSWAWGAEIRIKFSGNLERLKYKVCISTYSGSDSHIFQTASERAVLKYSSGTCLYHQFSLLERFNIPQIINNNFLFFFLLYHWLCCYSPVLSQSPDQSTCKGKWMFPHLPEPSLSNVSILAPNIRAARIFSAVIPQRPQTKR